jgi:hypothetical protein
MNQTNAKENQHLAPSTYLIKKLLEWPSPDGGGTCGEIHHRQGGRVATFRDEGSGGGIWVDRARAPKGMEPATMNATLHEFTAWANAHPALPVIFERWGFTPVSEDHSEMIIGMLIVEARIQKDIKRGYLVWQTDHPEEMNNAKTGRRKTRFDKPGLEWLTATVPNAICRNVRAPEWLV